MPAHRLTIPLLLFVAACAAPSPDTERATAATERDRALALAREALIVDTHIDVPYRLHR